MKKLILILALFFTPLTPAIAGPGSVNWERLEQRYGSTRPQKPRGGNRSVEESITGTGTERLARRLSRGFNCSFGNIECRFKPRRKGAKIQLEHTW